MKNKVLLITFLAFVSFFGQAQNYVKKPGFTDRDYVRANAGKTAAYLSDKEKQFILYLNLMRIKPTVFADTYIKDLEFKSSADYCTKVNEDEKKGFGTLKSNVQKYLRNQDAQPPYRVFEYKTENEGSYAMSSLSGYSALHEICILVEKLGSWIFDDGYTTVNVKLKSSKNPQQGRIRWGY